MMLFQALTVLIAVVSKPVSICEPLKSLSLIVYPSSFNAGAVCLSLTTQLKISSGATF